MLVHAYNCTRNSATGFSPCYVMYERQTHLSVDVTLGLAPQTTTAPDTSKFMQKMRECVKWAQEKAEAFQAKEAKCHKQNYDKCSRAVALEVGDMVLVHVTAFKGHHKIQDRWENREYVMEKWPYPDVPVYVVCPRDGKGTARPYIGTICFPSILTYGRMRRMHQWQELRTTTLQLQCYLWTVNLLMWDHLGWSHHAQQITHPRVVWISLLHLDAVYGKPRTNFHGGTGISVCRQVPVHLASGMHGLVCVSVSMPCSVCTPFSGGV